MSMVHTKRRSDMRPPWGGAYPVSILSVCLCLEAAQAGAQRRPELTVPVCSQPAPTLDGQLDDACWAEAEPVVHFHFSAHLRADRDGARADLVFGPARPAVSKTVTEERGQVATCNLPLVLHG